MFDLRRGLMNNYSQSCDVRVADNSVLVSIQLAASVYLSAFEFLSLYAHPPVVEYVYFCKSLTA